MNLTNLYEKLASRDELIQAEQYEMQKVAEEEDAAGRIMARGFMDELEKLSAALPTIASTSPNANQRGAAALAGRTFGQKPSVMGEMPAKGSAGAKTPGANANWGGHVAQAPTSTPKETVPSQARGVAS